MALLNTAPFLFLNLPGEIRMKIYVELLTTPAAITLYHDQTGRQSPLDLCPAILRVSRQVYNESAWVLYERNGFLISLTTEIDLIRSSPYRPGEIRTPLCQRPGLPAPRKADLFRIRDDSTGEEGGLIYPHCFRRLRHIGLVTAGDAVRGLIRDNPNFGDTYRLIVSILECLATGDGLHWTLGPFEPTYAEHANGAESFDFVLLRHKKILRLRDTCHFAEMDKLVILLAQVKRKRDVRTRNLKECMEGVVQLQIKFSIFLDSTDDELED